MIDRVISGLRFDDFVVSREADHWYMKAVALGFQVEQKARRMTPATVYNFSVRAAEAIIRQSRDAAIDVRQ